MTDIVKTTKVEYWLPDELWTFVKDYAGLIEHGKKKNAEPIQFKIFKNITTKELSTIRLFKLTNFNRPLVTFDSDTSGIIDMRFGKKQTTLEEYKVNFYKYCLMGGREHKRAGFGSSGDLPHFKDNTMNANKWRQLERIVKITNGNFGYITKGSIFKLKDVSRDQLQYNYKMTLEYIDRQCEDNVDINNLKFIVVDKLKTIIKYKLYSYIDASGLEWYVINNGTKKQQKEHIFNMSVFRVCYYTDVLRV